MQQVDLAFLFELGDACRSVRTVSVEMDRFSAYGALRTARDAIDSCVFSSVYSEHFRGPLGVATDALIHSMDRLIEKLFPSDGSELASLEIWDVGQLQSQYAKFETILISELQTISSYIVTRKGGFDVAAMVNLGSAFFSSDLSAKVPSAIPDINQAMRCIAFELPTAAGFHLHRANEAVLRAYWDAVTNGAARPKQSNMGVYLSALENADAGNQSVRAHLKSIKDFHRNPLMHPDENLDTMDQAIDLMSAIRCAIGYMLKEIPAEHGTVGALIASALAATDQSSSN